MPKRILVATIALVLFLAVLLAACRGQASPPGTEAAPATPTPTRPPDQAASATSAASAGSTTPASASTTGSAAAPPGCTVVSPFPTPGPEEQSLFPPVSAGDWTLGPDDARVTITEYSDFQ